MTQDELDDFLEHLNCACTDGGCIFRSKRMKGMVTNGGCRCTSDRSKESYVKRLIYFLKSGVVNK